MTGGKHECVICRKELKGKLLWIGININTGKYTFNEDLATQGYYTIGSDCRRKLIKTKKLLI